jgi:GTP-binding protein
MRDIRNIAVIAHVDHGKTTLVDELLKQSGTFGERDETSDRMMDSNDIEKERGITILAKNTAIDYKDTRINIIDTPGHADFGGEVERVLKMVDSVLLLVDAQEGVMPQTKFVVKKALEVGHRPILVVNKIDKPGAEADRVVDEVFDLLDQMGATEEQLEFPVIYAAAKNGISKISLDDDSETMIPLLDMILEEVPAPSGSDDNGLQLQVFNLTHDNFIGKIGVARIFNGTISMGENVTLVKADGEKVNGRVSKLIGFKGLERIDIEKAGHGDIVAIAGFETIDVGDSLCDPKNPMPLDPLHIEEPTLSVTFAVNNSPYAGTEGKFVTSNKIQERLDYEMNTNIAMQYTAKGEAAFEVKGRGELQITILAENMRREGFEFSISRPEVIVKVIDGTKCEPFEHLVCDVPDEFSGSVIETLGKRKAVMSNMVPMGDGQTRIEFEIPARGLIGYRGQFLTDTKGEGVMNHSFLEFRPHSGSVTSRMNGALVSTELGEAVAFSIFNLQDRGTLFISPQTKVYAGMVIGEHARANCLDVNPVKAKAQSNVRSSGADEAIKIITPRDMSLEHALEWIEDDELVEVTPISIRVRKRELDAGIRRRNDKSKKDMKK